MKDRPAPDRDAGVAGWLGRAALEQAALMASLVKWTLLAAVVGVLTGLGTTLFLRALDWGLHASARLPPPVVLAPTGFLAAYFLVHGLAPAAKGHGMEIDAVHRRWGRIPVMVAPVKLAATVVTVAAGGSVGKEGPAAQSGAALASGIAALLGLRPRDRRKLVIAGIGAGFAGVFGTPIGGAVAGVEVLVMGGLVYDALFPAFIAGIVSSQVTARLGAVFLHQAVPALPPPGGGVFLRTVAAGVLFGLVALVLIEAVRLAAAAARRTPGPRWAVAAGGGAVVGLLALVFGSRYLGLGVETVEQALRGEPAPPLAFLLKIVFTAVSLGAGGSGGIVTPIFFVGATAGSALGAPLGFEPGVLAAIGMVSVLSAAASAPIAASIMALELFGPALGPYAAVSCVVSFLVVGHRSVFGGQRLGAAKSPSIRAPRDIEVDRLGVPEVRRPRWRRAWTRRRPRWAHLVIAAVELLVHIGDRPDGSSQGRLLR